MSAFVIGVTVVLHVALAACLVVHFWLKRRDARRTRSGASTASSACVRLSGEAVARMDRLVAMAGFESQATLLSDALTLYERLAEEAMKGGKPGVMGKDGKFVELLTPGLLWAKQAGEVTGASAT